MNDPTEPRSVSISDHGDATASDPAQNTGSSPIRLVLVDDQELVRAGLRMVLGARPEVDVVGEATDGADVVDLVARTSPDVVLMDVRMPGTDGIAATRAIRDAYGSRADGGPGVLILTTFDLDEYVYDALRAGAGGFLVKDSPVEDLLTGIGHVHRADAIVGPRATELIEHFTSGASAEPGGEPVRLEELTPREHEVLELIATGRTNAEIARHLVLSEVTVKTHVGRILTKLDLRDRTQAVILAYERGVVRVGHGDGH